MSRKIITAYLAFCAMYGFLLTGATLIAQDGQLLVAFMFLGCFAPSLISDYKILREILQRYKGDKF